MAEPQDSPKTPLISMTASLSFEDMTFGSLKAFVRLAEEHGALDGEDVQLTFEGDDFYTPLGLEVTYFVKAGAL